jgi:hypothetical protein
VKTSSWTGLLVGAIALALLDALLTNRAAAGNVGGAETGLAGLVAKFIDPAVPAFGASSSSSSSSSSGSTSGSSGAQLGPAGTLGPLGPLGPIAPSHPTTTPAAAPVGA